MPEPTTEQWREIQAHLFAGRKIQAIKIYRDASGSGLAEAKEAMEAYAQRLHEESPESFVRPPGKGGCAGVILLFALLVWASVANLCFS